MSWTSYYISGNSKTFNRKAELDHTLWIDENKYKLIKSVMVSSTYYAAYKYIPTNTIHALICLTSINKEKGGWNEFYYKEINEEMGPAEAKCPKSILKLLSPTDNSCALDWRRRCQEYANFCNLYNKKRALTGTLVYDINETYTKGTIIKLYWSRKRRSGCYTDGFFKWSKSMIAELENLH